MMKRVQFEHELHSRLDRKPFQPFVIECEDGRRYVVGTKDALSYSVGNDALYVHPNGEWEFVDRDDVQQVLDLPPEPVAGNPG